MTDSFPVLQLSMQCFGFAERHAGFAAQKSLCIKAAFAQPCSKRADKGPDLLPASAVASMQCHRERPRGEQYLHLHSHADLAAHVEVVHFHAVPHSNADLWVKALPPQQPVSRPASNPSTVLWCMQQVCLAAAQQLRPSQA